MLFALLLSLPAATQPQPPIAIDRFLGWNDTDAPAVISDFEAQDLLNVESNLTGTAVKKRGGFTREIALNVATAPVTGVFEFKCDNGDTLKVVCHDRYCGKSTNGGAFTNFLSTAGGTGAVPTRFSFVSVDGDLYGANDRLDPVFKYDCTTLLSPTEIPAGGVLALTEDRLVVGDTSANPNRLHYSKSGDFTEFTSGSASIDPFTDDLGAPGERTTALGYGSGILWRWTSRSIMACETGDQYTQRCSIFSPNIGTNDQNSVVFANGQIYFRGNDNAYWRIGSDGSLIQVSKRISNFARNQRTGAARNNTQTSQTDWELGLKSPTYSWDTKTISGSVVPSSVTFVDTSSVNFAAGTLNNTSAVPFGSITLSSSSFRDNFDDGDFTSGATTWTVSAGAFVVAEVSGFNYLGPSVGVGNNIAYTSSVAISSGGVTAIYRFDPDTSNKCGTSPEVCLQLRLANRASDSSGSYWAVEVFQDNSANNFIRIRKTVSGSDTILASSQTTVAELTNYDISFVREGNGDMFAHWNGVEIASANDTTSISPDSFGVFASGNRARNRVRDLRVWRYNSPGTFLSQTFDTGYSTPTWGPFVTTVTNQGNTAVSFKAQVSADNSSFDALASVTSDLRMTNAQKRYIRYEATLTTTKSTQTPTITAVSLAAATTGQYRTRCIEPGTGITTFGIFSCDETKTRAESLVYYATSAASCATLPATDPTSWQTQVTNNAALTNISTNTAIYLGFRPLLGSSTDQAQVNACTVYWNEGTPSQPVWGAFDSISNAIYWTATTTGATQADRVIKYDMNLDQWYPFSLNATAISYFGNNLFFGSSNGGFFNKFAGPGVNTDNGSNIRAYWKSKDFGANDPFVEKDWKQISLLARNNVTGTLSVTWTDSFQKSGTYSVSLATTSTINYIRSSHAMQKRSPSNFLNVQLGNDSSTPFEVLGLRIDSFAQPWKVNNP